MAIASTPSLNACVRPVSQRSSTLADSTATVPLLDALGWSSALEGAAGFADRTESTSARNAHIVTISSGLDREPVAVEGRRHA